MNFLSEFRGIQLKGFEANFSNKICYESEFFFKEITLIN